MPAISLFLTVNCRGHALDQEILPLDIPESSIVDGKVSVKALKDLVSNNAGFPVEHQSYFFNGETLKDDNRQIDTSALDGQMLALLVRAPGQDTQPQARSANRSRPPAQDNTAQEAETVRLRVLGDPNLLNQLREQNPPLATAINDSNRFTQIFRDMRQDVNQRERERQHQIAVLNEDPFNVEAQRKIEEMIRQDRVMENLQHAYEANPEAFGRVTMLYVNAEVNGRPIKAFVDSGAQVTIMSPSCAEQCGIMRLIDTRFSGEARGVGTAKILGRVHHAEIKIGGAVMPCAFTVMEGKDVDLLFGLDMLKRYQANIDLAKNALCFQGIEVPFLPEHEIPRQMEEAALNEPTIPGPNGTEIGGRTGAVRPAGTSAEASGSSSARQGSSTRGNFHGQGQSLRGGKAPQSQTQQSRFPAESIRQLTDIGFSQAEAIQALEATDGNVELAAGFLFQ